jgi:branched-chain amino acid transport system substrate-binding protein
MMRLAAWLLSAALVAGCAPAGNTSGDPDIIIASDLPTVAFNDPFYSAVPLQHAIEFAIRERGSIAGFKLGYWPLDDSLAGIPNRVRAVENLERMIADHRVLGMIGPYTSNVAHEQLPLANRANFVMISPSNTEPCLTVPAAFCDEDPGAMRRNGSNNYFRIAAPDPVQGRGMARYIRDHLNVKQVAAFNEFGPVGDAVLREFVSELAKAGGELVLKQDFEPGAKNFAPFLKEAKAKGAEAIYAIGAAQDGACAARNQMSALMPGAYFLGTDGMATVGQCIAEAGGAQAAEGILATRVSVEPGQSTNPIIRQQVNGYRTAYPKASDISEYTFAAYDCTRILIDAIARAIQAKHGGLPTRAQVLAAVAQTNQFNGVTGTYSFNANGDALSPLMSIYQVHSGKWVYVEKLEVSLAGASP